MDIFRSYYSDPLTDSSSTSDNSGSPSRANLTEYSSVMLASNNPKKPSGRKKFQETRHSVYRGVRKRNSGKWVCEVREPNSKSRIWLGTHPTVEMAARAHDVAALALRGRSACLNFADSAWRLPIPASADSKDIQKAAAEAAEAFRPLEGISGESGSTPEMSKSIVSEESSSTPETTEITFFMNEEAPESRFFMDEEALFYMPGLITNMAEGLMLPPPQCLEIEDHAEADAEMIDMSLWSYSL
ncbi:dehydration-responsive element-binding protein 1A-like [Lycium ferocissimum]|uniref:dehydration-responsive element-binding protein 1A-like n=1 Tax=Lycium ferocissimum TaxID=112874 RepID=UPI002815F13C|nr:dehydration-responsive element-binding protein 1A-like [Lycium ferocissimum]